MIGRCALGRAPLFACLTSFVARDSFCPGHRCAIPYIDDVNINLTGVAVAGRRIFTLSTFGSAIQTRGRLGQHRATNLAIATRFRDPGHPQPPEPGSRAAGSSPRRTGRIATATPRLFIESRRAANGGCPPAPHPCNHGGLTANPFRLWPARRRPSDTARDLHYAADERDPL